MLAVLMLVVFELYIVECIHLFKRDLRPDLGWWVLNVWVSSSLPLLSLLDLG